MPPNICAPAIDLLPPRQRRTLAAGLLAQTRGDYAEAMKCYRAAARRDPQDFLSLYFAALTAFQLKDKETAIRLMYASLNRNNAHPEAWYNLGKFYQDKGELGRAVQCYVAALEHKADFGQALVNAGNVYWELGDEEMAEECYRRAMVAKEGGPEAVYNLSFLMHLRGEWPDAFAAAESRWQCPAYYREYGKPFMDTLGRWNGEPLKATDCLLLHGEQGHGDIIQMLRYVPEVLERISPARLVVGVLDGLVRLVETSFPMVRVVGTEGNIADCTHHLPTVSLPHVLQTSWEKLPPLDPYLLVGSEQPKAERFRIGLCWAGSPTHPRDYVRSAKFSDVQPLLDGVDWINLQVGPRADDWQGSGSEPLSSAEGDYLDTAKLIATCDLVITVDTSVAHLAAAMGKETWMLCPRFPDVRWMLGRSDSVWYPKLLIYRQTVAGDWSEVVRIIKQLLAMKVQFREAGL